MQSYILVERSLKDDDLGANSIVQEFLHVVSNSFPFILFVLNVGTSGYWIQVVVWDVSVFIVKIWYMIR